VDRRRVRERIDHLKKGLKRLETSRGVQRKGRRGRPTAALVGYTNAGKSTLLNRLSGAAVKVEDELFSTLDTTSRTVDVGRDYRIVLSDTVGFIRKLPHALVASFHATLAEVREADLLVHVVDASNEDAEGQIRTVLGVLEGLGASNRPTILVLNKLDRVRDPLVVNQLTNRFGPAIGMSARTGRGADALLAEIRKEMMALRRVVELDFPQAAGTEVARVYREGEVLERRFEGDRVLLRARLGLPELERYRKKGFVVEAEE
jgi:GTP-binding protein HflX